MYALPTRSGLELRPIVLGSLDPACLSALGRPEPCIGDGGSAAASQVTCGKPESRQASEEILPDTKLEGTAAHVTDFRGFKMVEGLAECLSRLLMTEIQSRDLIPSKK